MSKLLFRSALVCFFAWTGAACGSPPKVNNGSGSSSTSSSDDDDFDDDDEPASSNRNRSRSKNDRAEAAVRKAIEANDKGETRSADDYFRTALQLSPKHPQANQHYVFFLLEHKEASKALRVAKRFHDKVPGKAVTYHTLAEVYSSKGSHKRVVALMSGLLAFDEQAETFHLRGRARIKLGEFEEGIADIRRAIELEPDNPDYLTTLGAGLIRMGKTAEAKQTLGRALEVDPSSGRALLLLGLVARAENNNTLALEYLTKAIASEPNNARAHYELGITRNRMKNNEQAEVGFGRAVELDPTNGMYWYGYADFLRVMKRHEEAIPAYRESVLNAPENKTAWIRLAESQLVANQVEDALQSIKQGVEAVEAPRLYLLMAQTYLRMDQKRRARRAYGKFLDYSKPNAPGRREAEKQMRKLSE